MMKTKRTTAVLSLGLIAVLGLSIVGCTNSQPEPSPTSSSPTATPNETQTPTPSTTPTSEPEPENTISEEDITNLSELEQAQKAFPKVDATDEHASKEDIQLALLSADRYVASIFNSGYLANGNWANNSDYDFNSLYKTYGSYWTDEYASNIGVITDEIKAGDIQQERTLLNHFFFYDPEGQPFTLPETCEGDDFAASSCLQDGKLQYDSEWTYRTNTDGSIFVNIAFTANVLFVKDGVQGVSPVRYEVELEMVKNGSPDPENNRPTYIVNNLGGKWSIDNWREV